MKAKAPPASTTLVILGISGDLAQRKLLPALAQICKVSNIGAGLKILGVSRSANSPAQVLPAEAKSLLPMIKVVQMDYSNQSDFLKLKSAITNIGSNQVIFYFALPPGAVLPAVKMLGQAGLNQAGHKLLMEKPFGTDLASAKKLINQTAKYYKESQVYRIDHFLAKEMAQNIAVFLASNALFRDVWNNKFIEKIEIVAEESLGVEGRANFYEQTGALRDLVQSHLLQLAALTLMEPCPDVFDFSLVQRRRLAALTHLTFDKNRSFSKAQYKGYAKDVGNPATQTETFASLYVKSASPKWKGVPIQLTTGKALAEKLTEITVYFKKAQSSQSNRLKLRIQPREAIELELWVKKPGYEQDLQKLPLDFSYQQHFDRLPDAYEQVIVDAIRSRSNLFASSAEVIASWEILQPLLTIWQTRTESIRTYKTGSTVKDIQSIVNS